MISIGYVQETMQITFMELRVHLIRPTLEMESDVISETARLEYGFSSLCKVANSFASHTLRQKKSICG